MAQSGSGAVEPSHGADPAASRITVDDETGFPLFSSGRPVTSDDVRAMDDEE